MVKAQQIFAEVPDGIDENWRHDALLGGIAHSIDIAEAYWKTADLSEAKGIIR